MAKMKLSEEDIRFIEDHTDDDLMRLLLSEAKYPDKNIPFLVMQMAARKQIKDKLPSWYANDRLVFPSRLSAEQCSSEQTAKYKQQLVDSRWTLCDLTGGLGVDSSFFAQKVKRLIYVERFADYCEAARNNFSALNINNIEVINAHAADYLDRLPEVDAFYIDPARRGESNKRLFALSDCEPDLLSLLPQLWQHASSVIAKLSPMADIHQTLALLPDTVAVHVLSVKNECKELIFVLRHDSSMVEPDIHCINFLSDGSMETFRFTFGEEQGAPLLLAENVGEYLYEPNAAILKAGAFKQTAVRMNVSKLHVSSHLYTSKQLVSDFPGRIFQVREVIPFSSRLCKTLHSSIPQANITVRNFPLQVSEIRKRTKIAEGGDVYLFATTLSHDEKVFVVCQKVSQKH